MTLFIKFEPDPYHFVTTLKGFVFLDLTPAQTETEVNNIVGSTLFEGSQNAEATMQIRRFLATYHDNIPDAFRSMDDRVEFMRRTVDIEHLDLVRKEDIGTGGGKSHPAWNVYVHPPTLNRAGLQEWRRLIRSISFVTLSNCAGATYKIFHCAVCQSENHPAGMCRLPEQKGWTKPATPATVTNTNPANLPPNTREGGPSGRGNRSNVGNNRGRTTTNGRGRGAQRA